ncbi:hypothetical protein NBT05_16665 [Aquimarina sp. ERC-38]|uniref:HlyD family secretion protein n=1 Tax=Aquimarina sp. ERC-38 TaxID=2949996 RepID=UPI00224532C2|nr:hypothetical protein [Aquimarina sp. ERC-38]UZO80565.1 hypothetical protein NBT05_16665 [Aquimarina sp. ERC-38]
MTKKNIHYIVIAITGFILLFLLFVSSKERVQFYGIADSKETVINYNFPVFIEKIYVSPGSPVKKGTPLLGIKLAPTNTSLKTLPLEIEQLQAEKEFWKTKKTHEIQNTLLIQKEELNKINYTIDQLKKISDQNTSILKEMKSLKLVPNATTTTTEDELNMLKKRRADLLKKYSFTLNALENEKEIGSQPLFKEMEKIAAEVNLGNHEKNDLIIINAPDDGVVGDLLCKTNTYVKPFEKLLSFYESHPNIIKGYIHENAHSKINIGDKVLVSSSTNDTKVYEGTVTGLGSRIVTIPERLRKISQIKIYGREINVLIETQTNSLLQKEKVLLTHLENNDKDLNRVPAVLN